MGGGQQGWRRNGWRHGWHGWRRNGWRNDVVWIATTISSLGRSFECSILAELCCWFDCF
jgi:hypothetical protein